MPGKNTKKTAKKSKSRFLISGTVPSQPKNFVTLQNFNQLIT